MTEPDSQRTGEFVPRTLELVFDNVERYLAGKPLLNRISRRRQY